MELRSFFAILLLSSWLYITQSQLAYEDPHRAINRLRAQTDAHVNVGNILAQSLMPVNTGSLLAVLDKVASPQLEKQAEGTSLKFKSGARSTNSLNINPQCLADVSAFAQHLNPTTLTEWALRMADATGKPSAGILSGRFLFFGDFDECRAINANYTQFTPNVHERKFKGQFCTTKYRINFPGINPDGNYYWGLCLPDSCSDGEAVQLGNYALGLYNISIVQFEFATCHLRTVPWTARAIGVTTMLAVIVFLVILGTAVDILFIQWPKWQSNALEEDLGVGFDGLPIYRPLSLPGRGEEALNSHISGVDNDPLIVNGNRTPDITVTASNQPSYLVRILAAFSAWTNAEKLLSTKQPPGALSCVNGLRVISINWVVLGHVLLILTIFGDNIGAYSQKALKRWSFQAIINATFSVDTFFVLSGLLVTYLTLCEMKRNAGKINWVMFYVHRYLRLTPVYMICLGIWVSLMPYLVDGPIFPQKTGVEKDHCKNTWWGNLLYVQNLVKFKPTYCFQWAWYLAVDMQFYVISPLIILPLYYRPKLGYFIMALFFLMTTITPFVLSETRYYPAASLGKIKGHPVPRGDENYDLYISPYCRMGPYLAGMLCGYALYYMDGRRVRLHRALVVLGWVASAAIALTVLYGLKDYFNGKEMSLHLAATYNALSRTAWGVSVAWVIFSCSTGYGGVVNTFLSWSVWVPLSRLTYVVYLIHIIVIIVWGATSRSPFYIDDMTIVYLYLATLMATYALAFVFSLLFESPVMALEKLFFKKQKRS
ncbi:nose resistant to fluoxetine protein 6-like [Elysia marginata]|uniref:Nose resistant to fluoxetine protein 6-like n=1 Tax=Elysia marginata TaxID=1093978 RepID=A0AAV4FB55_9GAST|nr:nose resistant to fluoxetine protein 6-like [Elysia marginata]